MRTKMNALTILGITEKIMKIMHEQKKENVNGFLKGKINIWYGLLATFVYSDPSDFAK